MKLMSVEIIRDKINQCKNVRGIVDLQVVQ